MTTTIQMIRYSFTFGERTGLVEVAIVKRRDARRRLRSVRVIDGGANTEGRARAAALAFGAGEIRRVVTEIDLGEFANDDDGRNARINAVRNDIAARLRPRSSESFGRIVDTVPNGTPILFA